MKGERVTSIIKMSGLITLVLVLFVVLIGCSSEPPKKTEGVRGLDLDLDIDNYQYGQSEFDSCYYSSEDESSVYWILSAKYKIIQEYDVDTYGRGDSYKAIWNTKKISIYDLNENKIIKEYDLVQLLKNTKYKKYSFSSLMDYADYETNDGFGLSFDIWKHKADNYQFSIDVFTGEYKVTEIGTARVNECIRSEEQRKKDKLWYKSFGIFSVHASNFSEINELYNDEYELEFYNTDDAPYRVFIKSNGNNFVFVDKFNHIFPDIEYESEANRYYFCILCSRLSVEDVCELLGNDDISFENCVIYATASRDGQEHAISSIEDFLYWRK